MNNSRRRPQSWLAWLSDLDLLGAIVLIGLGSISVGFILGGIGLALSQVSDYRLVIGAGSEQGDSYILSTAIAKVVEQQYPNIHLEVLATGGTSENLKLLEENTIQLATAQADVSPGSEARTVAVLYPDKVQLIVHRDSSIQRFADLVNRKIALPTRGGQYSSFIDIAAHYGLAETNFDFQDGNEQVTNNMFCSRQADAVFRVRSLGNPSVATLIQQCQGQLLPIEQAAAMQIKYPAFEPSVIPIGAYQGQPPTPNQNLATVEIQRLLLARETVPNEVIRAITTILLEHRQAITREIPDQWADIRPLLANVSDPTRANRIIAPVHLGALAYYNRDQPSFVQENADYLALILTVGLLMGSWVWELKKLIEKRQKNNADSYTKQILQVIEAAQHTSSYQQTEALGQQLQALLSEAVSDLDTDRISEESFQSFRVVWQIAMDGVRERIQKQKNDDSGFSTQVLQLMGAVAAAQTGPAIQELQHKLHTILTEAVTALNQDRISRDAFQSFRVVWQIAMDTVKDQQSQLAEAIRVQ